MKKILSLLNFNQKIDFLSIIILIIIFSLIEICIFSFIPIILNFFSEFNQDLNSNFLINFFFKKDLNLKYVLILFFAFFIIRSLFSILIGYKKSKLIKSINDDLSDRIYKNYLNKNYSFFIKNNSSELVSNIIIEIDKFAYRLFDSTIVLITESFLVFSIFCFLLFNFFLVTVFFIVAILLFFIIFYLLYRKIFKKFGSHKLLHDAAKIDDLQKTFYMILNIKLDSLEVYFRSKFKLNTQLSSNSTFFLSFINEFSKPLIETIVMILIFIILSLFYFYFKISKFEIFSMLSIFVVGMFRILPSCNRILLGFNNIKYYNSSINLIYNQIKEAEIAEPENHSSADATNYSFGESIEFKNVNFYYPDKNPILKNINLRIKKNEIIGIKGKTGSGKTTLLNILCCLLKPTSGSIFIDEQLLTIEFQKFFKKKLGYVSQKIYLFNDTLVKNIIFGLNKEYYDEKLFEKAIKLSNLQTLFLDLKEGRETVIGERGIRFSGGQQQKIGIARALYKDPDIIIFDEATSSLDFISESEILNTIKDLRNQKTIVIVSHKDSSFTFCDTIYELEDGFLKKTK